MRSDDRNELLPIVDKDGRVIGSASRGDCHDGSKVLHPVVHLHLFDVNGRIFLQKRPVWKEIQPGKWDTAVGGHVGYGEDIEMALTREASEEIGINDFKAEFLLKYLFESERERELVYVYRTTYNKEITPSDEVECGRFWEINELNGAYGKEILTPNFEQEYRIIEEYLKNRP